MSEGAPALDGGRLSLKPMQEALLVELEQGRRDDLTRGDYERVAGVSRSQAAYDLADLVALGLLERVGTGRATRYRLNPSAGGRTRKWTDERIRTELGAFCHELGRWPRAAEFKAAGHADLYVAASRYGGIDHWAAEVGFGEEPQSRDNLSPHLGRGLRALVVGGVLPLASAGVFALFFVGDRSATVLAPGKHQADSAGSTPRLSRSALGRTARAVPASGGAITRPSPRAGLRLVARRGSWLEVRRWSSSGRILFEGVLPRGEHLRLQGALWLWAGSPRALAARLDGKPVGLPGRAATLVVRKGLLRVIRVAPPRRSEPEPVVVLVSRTVSGSSTAAPSSQSGTPAPSSGPQPDPRPGPAAGPTPDPFPGE